MEKDFTTKLYETIDGKRIGSEVEFREALKDTTFAKDIYEAMNLKSTLTYDEFLDSISGTSTVKWPIYTQETSFHQYQEFVYLSIIILILLVITYFIWKSKVWIKIWNKIALGLAIISIAYEIIIYALCDYFYKYEDPDSFNTELFIALNLFGLAILLLLFGIKILHSGK